MRKSKKRRQNEDKSAGKLVVPKFPDEALNDEQVPSESVRNEERDNKEREDRRSEEPME